MVFPEHVLPVLPVLPMLPRRRRSRCLPPSHPPVLGACSSQLAPSKTPDDGFGGLGRRPDGARRRRWDLIMVHKERLGPFDRFFRFSLDPVDELLAGRDVVNQADDLPGRPHLLNAARQPRAEPRGAAI